LSVHENVALPQRLNGQLDERWIGHLLAALDLASLAKRLPAQLSIGQRQRVAIARALAHRPAMVLADEPTASLGIDHGPAALGLLIDLARDNGTALLIVSHDLELLREHGVPLCDCRLVDGEVIVTEAG
jgi:putative ABC transport system ATP-binding protein